MSDRRLKLALGAWGALAVLCIVVGAANAVAAILGALAADPSWPLAFVIALACWFTAHRAVRRVWVGVWALRTAPWRRRIAAAQEELRRQLDER